MSKVVGVSVEGIDELRDLLVKKIPDKANNLMRTTVHGIASEVTKEAKKIVPSQTGNLKKSIKTRRRRSTPENPISEVYITSGKSQKNDGFYWRFVEHGTGGKNPQPAQPFIQPAKETVFSMIDQILEKTFIKKLEQAAKRELKKQAAKNK